jgi:cystinosin
MEENGPVLTNGDILSIVFGWIYCVAWTISFYPQIWYNHTSKSVTGLSIDMVVGNVIGFFYLTIYTACFLWSSHVRKLYRYRHDGSDNVVEVNDFVFALHALLLSLVCLYQVKIYRKKNEKLSFIGGCIFVAMGIGMGLVLLGWACKLWSVIEVLYTMGLLKVIITVAKYVPQVHMNYKRKSTIGWSIYNVLLDFTGGVFSVAQLFLDSILSENMTNITGNSAKLAIGLISITFGIIFMFQHYILYAEATEKPSAEPFKDSDTKPIDTESKNDPFTPKSYIEIQSLAEINVDQPKVLSDPDQ